MKRSNDYSQMKNDGNGSQKSAVATISKPPKKAAVKKTTAPAAVKTPSTYLVIDHPQDGDKVQKCHYAIRLGAGGGHTVEIQINGGDWMHCRHNSGYYWFDWMPSKIGANKITARMKTNDGDVKKSKVVSVTVA